MSGLSTLLWCKGYVNLSPSNSRFFKISRRCFFSFHLQLRFLHLWHMYMQNQNIGIRDAHKKKRIQKKPWRCMMAVLLCNSLSLNKIRTATTSTSVPLSTAAQPGPPSQLCFTQRGKKSSEQGPLCPIGMAQELTVGSNMKLSHSRAKTLWSQTAWEHLLSWLSLFSSFLPHLTVQIRHLHSNEIHYRKEFFYTAPEG